MQLSDLHVGTYVGEREFRSGLELVRRARPDIIVLTGDLIDYDPRYAGELVTWANAQGGRDNRGTETCRAATRHRPQLVVDADAGAVRR